MAEAQRLKLEAGQIATAMPIGPPFLFLDSAELGAEDAGGVYAIKGSEHFLQGHFKERPVFPGSLMVEALGQLAVCWLLLAPNKAALPETPQNVYFTSCDGVRCSRVCVPGDRLELQVRIRRLRAPLAVFEGAIHTAGEKTAAVETLTLAFQGG